jgi:protein TonB
VFEELRESGLVKTPTHKRWTVILSAALEAMLLCVLILAPLVHPEALSPKRMLTTLLLTPPPPPPPPLPVAAAIQRIARPIEHAVALNKMVVPAVVPKKVALIKDDPLPPDVGAPGVAGGVPGGQMGGVLGGIVAAAPNPALPPASQGPKVIHLGGQLEEARLVHYVEPMYPLLARQGRIEGVVMLHAIIAEDGTVRSLQALSGPPLLIQSAVEAVRQWRYQPTLLNGEPCQVDTQISVSFHLASTMS